MKRNVLVVVDMQKDFLNEGGALYIGHDTSKLKKRVAEFMKGFDGVIIGTADSHGEDDAEFPGFPKHCLATEEGSQLVDEVSNAADFKVVAKKSYTDMLVTEAILEPLVKNREAEVHVVGVCTHICVHDIIADLVNRTKNDLNFIPHIILHTDMIDDFDPEMAVNATKRLKSLYGVEVV